MRPQRIDIIRINNAASTDRVYSSKLELRLSAAAAALTMSIVYVVLDVESLLVTTSESC